MKPAAPKTPLCELHCHSTCSDGTLDPTALVRRAHARGLAGLVLTDHDTFSGLNEAGREAEALGLVFLSGVEISSNFEDEEVHLLGYGFSATNPSLVDALALQVEARRRRIPEILERFHVLGIEIQPEDVAQQARGAAPGRPHVARALVARGICRSVQEVFEKYLHDRGPAYVPKKTLPAAQAIELLHAAGGIAVLAHPEARPIQRSGGLPALVRCLAQAGLDGIEVQHPAHTPQKRRRIRTLGRKLDLLLTGGSDFHGSNSPGIELGSGRGNIRVPLTTLDEIRTRTT